MAITVLVEGFPFFLQEDGQTLVFNIPWERSDIEPVLGGVDFMKTIYSYISWNKGRVCASFPLFPEEIEETKDTKKVSSTLSNSYQRKSSIIFFVFVNTRNSSSKSRRGNQLCSDVPLRTMRFKNISIRRRLLLVGYRRLWGSAK